MEEQDEDEVFAKYYAAKKLLKKVKKFTTFNERIAEMGGDNGRFSRKLNAETSTYDTYFEEALDTWRGEDQGPEIDSFVTAIQPNDIKTYAQLLHKSGVIFDALQEHLAKSDSTSIPAFCSLLSALARDLREKFSKHCWKSFEILTNILDIGARVAENVEAAYLCLTVLVKVQAGYLSKQLKKTFTNFLPLFASSRDFARRFASESFAYLLRKSSDLRGICAFIVKQAYKTPHNYLSDGCALLFYNTYIGIAGSFHSNSSQYFREIVESLVTAEAENPDEKQNFEEFCVKILVQMIGYTIEYAKKSTYDTKNFYQLVLTNMLGETKKMADAIKLMRLIQPCIIEKNEQLMNEVTKKKKKKERENKKNKGKNEFKKVEKIDFQYAPELKKSMENVVGIEDFHLESHGVDFFSETLLSIFNDDKNRLFSREIALKIVGKSKDYDIVIQLLLRTLELESFDLYLMPALGKIASDIVKNESTDSDLIKQITSFYSFLCSKRRPIKETLSRSTRANFFDLSNHYSYREWIVNNFKAENRKKFSTETMIDMLVAWPWLFSQSDIVKGADDVLQLVTEAIKSKDSSVLNSQLVFAGVVGLYLTQKKVLEKIKKEDIEVFLARHNCSDSSLLAFEIFVDVYGVSKNVDYMNKVVELVYPAFLSANDDVRKIALKVLCNFKLELPKITDDEGKVRQQHKSVFEVLYEAEDSELTNFRERLLHFRKLRYGFHKEFIPIGSSDKVEKLILCDLVSQFFVNFTPLWSGIHEILLTFAKEMNIDAFWSVMSEWINNVNINIKKGSTPSGAGRLVGVDAINRSDFVNARIQLFEFFETIPEVSERRTRVLSPLLLAIYDDFIKLTSHSHQMEIPIEEEEEQAEEEDNEEENEETTEVVTPIETQKRNEVAHTLKALNCLLRVFSKFNAAKSVYLEPKLLEMYEKLLSAKQEGLQKAALDCVFSYRNSILANYRENLEGLIDEKKLRQSLVYFKLSNDEEDVQVIDEHRSVVVPILLRILHGKLMVNNPKKKGIVSRRNGIIYVIGGCRSDELTFFFKLYFSQIYSIFGENASFAEIDEKCAKESFMSNINMKVFIGILQAVSEMLKKISRSMTEREQKMILHVVLACGIVCKHAKKAEMMLDLMKILRMSVCDRIGEFFNAFPERAIEKEEILTIKDSILSAYVQDIPMIDVIQRNEGYMPVAPLAVVKLLANICRFPSFYQLLTIKIEFKIQEESRSCDTLDILLAPLLWSGCFELMFKTIRAGIMKLSELADEPLIPVSGFVDCKDVVVKKGVNYGTAMISTKIGFVLDFLTMQIEKEVTTTKRPASESIILLERFSSYVSENEEIANRLAVPLLMCVERKKCHEDTLVNMMKSLARIAPMLSEPKEHFARLPRMFAKMEGRTLRDALVEMVEGFVKSKKLDEKTREILHLLCELDAWDRTRVDEPHFERRYAAYTKLAKCWSEDTLIDSTVLGMIVCSHFQLISTTLDLSLRMTAGNNVRGLVQFAGRTLESNEKRQFLEAYLNPTVVIFLKHDVDAVREETLNTLSVMAKCFKENQHLAELDAFSNDDEEKDFLKNMNHIQIHRRQRAIREFVQVVEEGTKQISFNSMNKYLIPMINPYLVKFSDKFNAIADESLRLLKLIMSKAPWGKYCSYLESWISRVEKASNSTDEQFTDKALVRIVVAVIESFHFDVNVEEEKEDETEEEVESRREKQMILDRIGRIILPRLTKCLDSQTHAIERKAQTNETKATALHMDIQRTPIALAIVKLIQKLPEAVAGQHLHGVILKLCNLMMTHSFDVRETARKTLLQIVKCLGPKYLSSIITEISLTMVKGFQLHVAVFSIHSLIVNMKDSIKCGDLDNAIDVIVKMCIRDQFTAAEEKEVGAIKAECPEAKGNRTPETMQHLGRIVSPAGIQLVLNPFRDVVNEQPSARAIQKVSDLLSKFSNGLKDNEGLDHSQLLSYIFKGLTADLAKLNETEVKNSKNDAKDKSRRPESCLIIPAAPKRIGALTKVVIRSRDHVFAEFFVQLFSSLLKEKKLDTSEDTMISRINPFVPLILDCFDYKYEKLISSSLRALCSMIQMQLAAISANSQRVSDILFVLLSDYASVGAAGNKPAIVQLNQLIYKGFTSLINSTGSDFLDNDKLTLLLAYAEADVLDQHKHATMFSLIKALVKKGVRHERMAEIMDHLSETAIRSPLVNIRTQCREVLLDYIGGASDEEKSIEKHVEFFLDQLDYEYETGRQSAAEMLSSLFKNLLSKTLESVHMLCVVKIGAAMMNDESPKVAAQLGLALRHLLENVGVAQRQETFEVICQWLESEDENARAVGIQVAVQLSYVEKETMIGRVETIMCRIRSCLFEENSLDENSENTLIVILNGLTRILANVGVETIDKFHGIEFIESLGDLCKCEESIQVMNAASTLIGQILTFVEIDTISEDIAKEVCSWMSRQLRNEKLDTATGEQASKNIVCLSKRIEGEGYQTLIGHIAAACRFEIKHQVKQFTKRMNCFKLIAALFVTGTPEKTTVILDAFMPLLVRELKASSHDELSKLTQEVCGLIKKRIGEDDYGQRVAACQKNAAGKISDRKRKIRELAVTAPQDAAELRRKKNKKKTETRKRKIDEMKPHRLVKRRAAEKRKAMDNEDD